MSKIEEALKNPRVKAFLDMISQAEGADYDTLVHKGAFNHYLSRTATGLQAHPGRVAGGSAAGRYQFLYDTWEGLRQKLGLSDFSPRSQDLGAVQLLKDARCLRMVRHGKGWRCVERSNTDALTDILNGQFETAITKANKVWASLPGSPYGQPVRTLARVTQDYNNALQRHKPDAEVTAAKIDTKRGPASGLQSVVLLGIGALLIGLAVAQYSRG